MVSDFLLTIIYKACVWGVCEREKEGDTSTNLVFVFPIYSEYLKHLLYNM